MLWLALLAVAHAHRPHDIVTAIAFAPDYATSGRAWAVMEPGALPQLLYTDDFGAHWTGRWSPLGVEAGVVGAAWSDDAVRFVTGSGLVWEMDPDGGAFGTDDLGVEVHDLRLFDDVAVVPGDDGVFVGPPGQWSRWLRGTGVFRAARDGDGTLYAVARDGAAYRAPDPDTTEALPAVPERPLSLVAWDGVLFAGTEAGVWRLEAGGSAWTACAAVPIDEPAEHDGENPLVGVADGRLYTTTGERGLFLTDATCAAWTAMDAGVDISWSDIGGTDDATTTFVEVRNDGDRWLVAGFAGVVTSGDGGASFAVSRLYQFDSERGLSFAPGFPADPRVVLGGYGGGLWWSDDAGATWTGTATGIGDDVNCYDLWGFDGWNDGGEAFLYTARAAYVSTDGGDTFLPLDPGMDPVIGWQAAGGFLWALGSVDHEPVVARTTDGVAWEVVPGLDAFIDGDAPSSIHPWGDAWLVGSDDPLGVGVWDPDAATWQWLDVPVGASRIGGVTVRSSDDRIVWVGDVAGAWLSDDGGATFREASSGPGERPTLLSAADDGTLFVVDGENRVWRSDDFGDTWVADGEPLVPAVLRLLPSPGYAETGLLLAGTRDGTYWTDDGAATWHALPAYERAEDLIYTFSCRSPDGEDCPRAQDGALGSGTAYRAEVGDTLAMTTQMPTLRILAVGAGAVDVAVDGAALGRFALGDELPVGDGVAWRDVTFTLAEADGGQVLIDAIEGWGDGEVLPIALPADTGAEDTGGDDEGRRCGCGRGANAGSVVLPLLLLARRRRATGDRDADPAGHVGPPRR